MEPVNAEGSLPSKGMQTQAGKPDWLRAHGLSERNDISLRKERGGYYSLYGEFGTPVNPAAEDQIPGTRLTLHGAGKGIR
ncbi:hypothetical protein P9D34_03875 [Bacillus swezeyi]|uniref:Uncharacterized protein n=1 Tax=Bacillus swezeyi TaxID=1925020 RepID=A0A1R1S047_9BACI|nr:hypothetical protein [Bacillus swezeyi]MEC1259596.1 hypothetical protein [Bacillus swezeyi]MED2927441.1 hypothetical protein [Bacillus swezeyi]MED2941693.1 hypothetical protein [Bacillus swezeyi]MED2962639.1 hypothetical protein [Bacillus swezeyi]MED2977241.1 hypothetical protein [Bacillus swezeyi]